MISKYIIVIIIIINIFGFYVLLREYINIKDDIKIEGKCKRTLDLEVMKIHRNLSEIIKKENRDKA